MKFNLQLALLTLISAASTADALSFPATAGLVDLSDNAQRDVSTMAQWAEGYGAQKADGFEITSYDGQDYLAVTQQNLPAGSPVLYIPSDLVFSSNKAAAEFGGALGEAEQQLAVANLQDFIPLFRVFVKVLIEYEKGAESPWFPWLNSLPRQYYNGASMTSACFDCLPPYAAWLALTERINLTNFKKASKFLPLSNQAIANDDSILTWAYNVAVTRSIEWNGERLIAPMADFFNHGAETEVDISYDADGNCMVYSSRDVPAGSPLRVSLGDPTNPSPLFATYGFLDESSTATFCKLMHMMDEMQQLGYSFSDLLFFKETGEISAPVYDVVLYYVLLQNDPGTAQGFLQAVTSGDEATKNQFHEQYFAYTKEELQKHVDSTLADLDRLSTIARSYDVRTHPRVPVILQHNAFVKETFLKVKQTLDNM
ncbi:unnamed protein product [Cylindrotheca closterium]|uniref:SET domain-containing protein n=1 Tax=Cylindrotheca closterium TaxID=2856 RepID=A0AAD2JMN2_9STRA|nr:unnamed protein product [Cylindrotheca closterium]